MIDEKTAEAMVENLTDWRWRFTHLYWIKPAELEPECIFCPRAEQWEILELLYDKGERRLAILKARQLGFSTLLSLICLDWLLFRPGVRIAIVDKKASDAHKKLDKIRFAWERLPYDMREQYRVDEDNKSVLAIRMRKEGDGQRYVEAGEKARGDTFQLLWVSEWGPIQKEDPKRSDDIADGSCPAAEKGVIIVETTWRGGKSGRLYDDIVDPASKLPEKFRTRHDWHILFFAWYLDKTLVFDGDASQISPQCREYLKDCERKGAPRFTKRQALWYFKVAWPKREKRYEEYPTLLDEIFLSPEPGAIYAEEMASVRAGRRLTRVPVERGLPVFACFDIGRDDAMPCTLIQIVGQSINVVDYHCNNKEGVKYYADWLTTWMKRNKVANLRVVLPHDGRRKAVQTEHTAKSKFEACGHEDVIVVTRIPRIWDGIDIVRDTFPYIAINADQCEQEIKIMEGKKFPSLVECLDRYHSIDQRDGKNISREPVHDKYSHGCDSFRTFCEARAQGLIANDSRPRRVKNLTGGGKLLDEDFDRKTARASRNIRPFG